MWLGDNLEFITTSDACGKKQNKDMLFHKEKHFVFPLIWKHYATTSSSLISLESARLALTSCCVFIFRHVHIFCDGAEVPPQK